MSPADTYPTLIANAIRRPDEPGHFMVLKDLPYRATAHALGVCIADDPAPIRLQEAGRDLYDPVVYFDRNRVDMGRLSLSDKITHCPLKGTTEYYHLTVGSDTRQNAAWRYVTPLDFDDRLGRLTDRIAFDSRLVQVVEHTTEDGRR